MKDFMHLDSAGSSECGYRAKNNHEIHVHGRMDENIPAVLSEHYSIFTEPRVENTLDHSSEFADASISNINLANAITMIRLLAVPLFIWMYCRCYFSNQGISWVVVWLIFVLCAMTDKIDGFVARKFNMVTALGIFLDPIADKFLVGSACVLLAMDHKVPWWFPVIVISRELAVTCARTLLINLHGVLPASSWGKWKTMLQVILIALLLIPQSMWKDNSYCGNLLYFLLIITVIVTVLSGVLYIKQWRVSARV